MDEAGDVKMGGQARVALDMIMVTMGIENGTGSETFLFNDLNQALDMNFFVSVFTLIISPTPRYSGI